MVAGSKLCSAPVHYLFVNSNNKTKITISSHNPYSKLNICNSEGLFDKIGEIESHEMEKISQKELKKITRLLLANHVPEDPDILAYFEISLEDIQTGVQCPKSDCEFFGMEYRYGTWCCPKCGTRSKDAHIPAIQDYFLLIKPSITNSELRNFLHIDSIKVANKILISMNLPYTGKNKGRVYYKPK